MRRIFVLCGLMFLFALVSVTNSYALEFSADMIIKEGAKVKKGKLYIKGEKQRIEAEGQAVTIIRPDKKMVWMLIPEEKTYIDMPLSPDSAQKPEAGAKLKDEVSRKPLGDEKIDGYQTKKYEVTVKSGPKTEIVYQWVLSDIGFPIKMISADGSWSIEYKNIKKTVLDSLFEIPSNYEKMSVPLPPGFPGIPEDDPPEPAKKTDKNSKK